ncbi:uncharacterized protein HMPREF1120_01420 [Exophiala dermatitidis NIH/UT8656]|uniref:Uncharacterized protein n=1 Tax=Exophiala dermatitidis (strain ATCC 34100 / CBS 525.76 / NIH/UT8656) TaxID=858893 RepID=H6BNN8_EXODN|nr:uncharacterized protein HMPREF1120_01420 [Exophiala dermatitidis NIH/UT8656]EHY53223.1 hypothetical protein HMPREF1120_01420 [Exophiala dermatitidis NIH/UT8656]
MPVEGTDRSSSRQLYSVRGARRECGVDATIEQGRSLCVYLYQHRTLQVFSCIFSTYQPLHLHNHPHHQRTIYAYDGYYDDLFPQLSHHSRSSLETVHNFVHSRSLPDPEKLSSDGDAPLPLPSLLAILLRSKFLFGFLEKFWVDSVCHEPLKNNPTEHTAQLVSHVLCRDRPVLLSKRSWHQ